jgi:GAF domain-containing protein
VDARSDQETLVADRLRERLQHLQQLAEALTAAASEEEAIDATLTKGVAVFAADQAVIATLDATGTRFTIVAARGYDGVQETWATFPNTNDYPLSEAVDRGTPVVVQGPTELARRYPAMAAAGRSATLVCLPMGDFGGIALGYAEEQALEAADLEFMQAVARQCADAIRRTALDAERRRRTESLALLAEAGAALAKSLDPRATLAEVARLAVPRLADCCIVDVAEASGLHQLAMVHVLPELIPLIAELEQRYPADPNETRSAVGEVIRTGLATLVPDVGDDYLGRITRDSDHLEGVHRLGMRSLIIVPLTARGRTIGAITLIRDVSPRRYDEQDLATAQGLADRAAMAIDNARLHRAQVEIAASLQSGLLPPALPEIPGVDAAAVYIAGGEGVEVGGDFYDLWELPGGFGIAIGDVSGKGAEAASMTALARHTIRVASLHERTPSRVLAVLNSELRRHGIPDLFCTAAYAHGTTTAGGGIELVVSRGGHPPALIRSSDGMIRNAGQAGTLLGVLDEPELSDEHTALAPGDMLVLYTDGVTERRGPEGMLDEDGLAKVVAGTGHATAAALAGAVERAVVDFADDPPQDDVAVIVIRAL